MAARDEAQKSAHFSDGKAVVRLENAIDERRADSVFISKRVDSTTRTGYSLTSLYSTSAPVQLNQTSSCVRASAWARLL